MPTNRQTGPVSKPTRWSGRLLVGFAILFLLLEGAIKLVPGPVADMMDRIGYGSTEILTRVLGATTIVCTMFYAVPPTSILGAILTARYLADATTAHLRTHGPMPIFLLLGLYLGAMVWSGLRLRDGKRPKLSALWN